MKARLLFIFRNYWVEMIVIPPFLVALCYFFYGDAYLSSGSNFVRMTFPWLFMSIISPIACHWVRRITLQKFKKLEDWPKRVVWSILGYMFFTAGFAKTTYFLLGMTRYTELVPSEKNFYGLLILVSMCVLITAMLYEGITYFGKWKDALTETEQVEKLHLESQFQSLQSQLNPHFQCIVVTDNREPTQSRRFCGRALQCVPLSASFQRTRAGIGGRRTSIYSLLFSPPGNTARHRCIHEYQGGTRKF